MKEGVASVSKFPELGKSWPWLRAFKILPPGQDTDRVRLNWREILGKGGGSHKAYGVIIYSVTFDPFNNVKLSD